jgi:DNA-binding PadR family transcriptional regulator
MARRAKNDPESFLPLSPSRFQVLLALAEGDKHGYAVLKDVERLSDGKLRLSASTLYSVLDRLEEDGLIEESEERPDPALDDERRRYYRLTGLGAGVARAEAKRLERMLDAARSRRLLKSRA